MDITWLLVPGILHTHEPNFTRVRVVETTGSETLIEIFIINPGSQKGKNTFVIMILRINLRPI